MFTELSKIWVWDDGSRGQKGTGSRIRNTDQAVAVFRIRIGSGFNQVSGSVAGKKEHHLYLAGEKCKYFAIKINTNK
jgi:hypothetical protein